MVETGRRFGRFALSMPATLIAGKRETAVVTEDVSRNGMRLLTDAPPPDRRFVQIRLALSAAGETTINGITAYGVRAGGARRPGVGVQLYGNPPNIVADWERFVQGIASGEPAESVLVAKATTLPLVEPVRRRFERVRALFEVRYPSVEVLLPLTARDVSMGGLFLAADTLREVGEELGLEVVHPVSGEHFPVRCVIRRVVRDRDVGIGMGVEFLDMDDARRAELWAFVTSGLALLEAEDFEALPEPDGVVFELDLDID